MKVSVRQNLDIDGQKTDRNTITENRNQKYLKITYFVMT